MRDGSIRVQNPFPSPSSEQCSEDCFAMCRDDNNCVQANSVLDDVPWQLFSND